MALYDNSHQWTKELSTRIKDLAIAGIPKYLICKIVKLDDDTLNKYYSYELECSEPEAVERVAKTVIMQAEAGDQKSQALYLKTKGAKYGWIEKQVIEQTNGDDTQALKEKIAELEEKYRKDY